MTFSLAPLCLLLLLAGDPDGTPASSGYDPVGVEPSNHQDSAFLGPASSAVMPADGLLSLELGGRTYSTVYQLGGYLERISQKDLYLRAEAGPLPWLQLRAELPYRTWSGGKDWIPESGSGVADGSLRVTAGRSLLDGWLHGAVFGGSNLALGSKSAGLTEGATSPHVGAALSVCLWQRRQVPELRLHLNYSHRWNRSEETGYGLGPDRFEPWYPKYPSAGTAGGNDQNDQSSFAAALEFRKGTTTLWLDYIQDRFTNQDLVSNKEQYTGVGAGVRWGVMEGWAIRGHYLVSLATDDLQTDWDPAYPDLVMEVGVSRQLSIGGQDRDHDGVPDRHDHCPLHPEDMDGYQDEDGCPEIDNDGDGIPDYLDAAPNAPEDYDGFEDHDGMPDPDNDGDGIFDWLDACPNDPEDIDGHRDDDGCPDEFADRDGDGIEDSVDGCPDEPEDLDGFEDDDGCPDLDNDLDGIPDALDKCPDEPEDYDGVDDEDGCPE